MAYKDKEKQKEYQKQWHKENKNRLKESKKSYSTTRRHKHQKIIRRFMVTKGCLICGYNKSYHALCFHHLDPKEKKREVGKMVNENYSLKTLKKEIAKCVVLCSNCHRELHGGITKLP